MTLLYQRKFAVSAYLIWTDSGSLRIFDFIDSIVAVQADFVASRVCNFTASIISLPLPYYETSSSSDNRDIENSIDCKSSELACERESLYAELSAIAKAETKKQ
jgi:hypothetical protein